jgi:hypothetical protein
MSELQYASFASINPSIFFLSFFFRVADKEAAVHHRDGSVLESGVVSLRRHVFNPPP